MTREERIQRVWANARLPAFEGDRILLYEMPEHLSVVSEPPPLGSFRSLREDTFEFVFTREPGTYRGRPVIRHAVTCEGFVVEEHFEPTD